ncbi:MAG: hypothetical protein Q8Q14_06675 [Gemmatimonadales bacterium]|nr:hypothetical protein [Gemmatimonadales bacterium]
MGPEEVFALLAVVAGCIILGYPLVRALAERLRPREIDPGVREELQAMREDLLAEMQQTRRDVAELEERVDFAERLLARQRDADLPKLRS